MPKMLRKTKESDDQTLRLSGQSATEGNGSHALDSQGAEEPKEAPKQWRSPYTHDTTGNPLPNFILRGDVAYVPMVPNPEWERRRKLTLATNWKPPCLHS
jgi:hypothetical protein